MCSAPDALRRARCLIWTSWGWKGLSLRITERRQSHRRAGAFCTGSIFRRKSLEPYIQYCREQGVHFNINTVFDLYVDDLAGMMPEMLDLYAQFLIEPKQLPSWDALEDAPVKMTISGQKEDMDRVEAELGLWDHQLHYIRSGDYFIDIMHQDATKGSALAKLAELRGIAPEQVLAIGNYYNDLSMIQFAGMGIAMDNAPIEVKAAAQEVTKSNNEEGVHDALVKHCLEAGAR